MPSPWSANLQAALLLQATTAKSTTVVTDVDNEGWQVVAPRARYKRSTTSALPGSPAAQDTQKGPGANTVQKSGGNAGVNKNAGGRRKDSRRGRGGAARPKRNNNHSTAKAFGGEMKKPPAAAPSQALKSTKTWSQITMQVTAAAPVEPQESTLENNGNHDSAQLILAPVVEQAQPSIQLDSQTGLVLESQASFSDKEVVDLSSLTVSLLQSRSAVLDHEDVSHESVPVAAAVLTQELDVKSVEGTPNEAKVPVAAASVEDKDHKNEAVELISSSNPSSGPEEQTIIETAALSQSLSTEITIVTGSSVAIECENLDYGMATVEEPKSVFTVRNNASEGGTERMDAAMRRLSVAIPPFQSNHGVVPLEAVAVIPAVTTWTVTATPFMYGTSLHPWLYSFPPAAGEPIYQVATPMTTMRTRKLNPYAREFLPSYIRDQSSSFGIMETQHCQVTATETVVAAPLNSRGSQRVDTTESASGAGDNNSDNKNGSEGQVGRQTQRMQRQRRNRQPRGRGEGPNNRSLGDFFRSSN